jgi:mannose/fructose/N-acetylgalactosamine-specific phosphotransferase system component IIB
MIMDMQKHISTYKNRIDGESIFLFDLVILQLKYILNIYKKNFTIHNINVVSIVKNQNKEQQQVQG